jgi:hypothetical protein
VDVSGQDSDTFVRILGRLPQSHLSDRFCFTN